MQLHFDPTISAGSIVAAIMAVFGIAGIAYRFYQQLAVSLSEHHQDIRDLKDDVSEMKPKVNQILVLATKQDDHDRRMTRLEDRVFAKD